MTGMQIDNLKAVRREGRRFFADYEWEVTVDAVVMHTVYPTGPSVKPYTNTFATQSVTHTVKSTQEISRDQANFAVLNLPTFEMDRLHEENWTVHFGGVR